MQDLYHVETDEILTLLKEIDITKSSAIDNLSSKLLKDALNCLVEQFKFPEKWKRATISPLPKDGDPSLCNNHSPISLLLLQGKIAEKVVHTFLINYLENITQQ